MKRKKFRNLPPCTRGDHVRTKGRGLRLCGCYRCAIVRAIALLRVGADSDLPGAALTRAVAENA